MEQLTLDLHQLDYRSNRYTEDANSIAIHMAETHLDKRNSYVKMLCIDHSSAFNTIVPSKFDTKLRALGLDTTLCNWILDFLTGRPQALRIGNNTSSTLTQHRGHPEVSSTLQCTPCSPTATWHCRSPTTSSSLLTTPSCRPDKQQRRVSIKGDGT